MSEKVLRTGIQREKNYLYFIDKDGDISKVKMSRGRPSAKNNRV